MGLLKELSTKAPEELDKEDIQRKTEDLKKKLDELQAVLYAEAKHSVLIIIQAMDAGGKDGAIKDVFDGLNPQGIAVKSFKAPTADELSHDFLWRVHQHTPARGMIQIFNRSHYEDVLITRVHEWCDDETATKRFKAINDFENMLITHNNTVILKFYLHISPEEQQERLKERMEDPKKAWKFKVKDFEEAKLWDRYMKMYEDVFEHCNEIPWTIVPSHQNWYKEYLIAKAVADALEKLGMQYPSLKEV